MTQNDKVQQLEQKLELLIAQLSQTQIQNSPEQPEVAQPTGASQYTDYSPRQASATFLLREQVQNNRVMYPVSPPAYSQNPQVYDQYQQKCMEVAELNERLKTMEAMCQRFAQEQETKLFNDRRARLMGQFEQQSVPNSLPQAEVRHISYAEMQPPVTQPSPAPQRKVEFEATQKFEWTQFESGLNW